MQDVVTFEVLRHRLWAINDEAAAMLRLVSGSPVATEIADYNTTIMTADGHTVYVGVYMVSHGVGQGFIVRHILENYAENPGIDEGDIFICNNPYSGALHQNDVTLVAPIHSDGGLLAWTGATIHQVDVGGPVKGSQGSLGSTSIYEEAPVMPPMKLVEGGLFRKDIEEAYLIRSRTRELNARDLRAKLAAVRLTKKRVQEIIDEYGSQVLGEVLGEIVSYTETHLRDRLRELPDGVWRHTTYIDQSDGQDYTIYPVMLAMKKRDGELEFDFSGTAPQAPAIMNCTYSGLVAGVVASVLGYLCFDLPWSPAAVERVTRIIAEPGTVVNASWPAGCSKATTGGSPAATVVANICLAKMLMASKKYRDHAMSAWTPTGPSQELFGIDQQGKEFGASLLDGLAGGGGARSYKDGIDTSGVFRALSAAVANVETYESRYPILYLYKRQEPDSGGAGTYRGGNGISTMFTPHDVPEIPTNNMHTFSVEQPGAVGLSGGYPGSTNFFSILRGSNVWELFESGVIPISFDDMEGQYEPQPGLSRSFLKRGDICRLVTSGGGGYGDPLDRQPEAVLSDVLSGLITERTAREVYGVAVTSDGRLVLDVADTNRRRQDIRKRRLKESRAESHKWQERPEQGSLRIASLGNSSLIADGGNDRYQWLSEYLLVRHTQNEAYITCRCGAQIAPASANYKEHVLCCEKPLDHGGPLLAPNSQGGFVLREFYCPSCLTVLEVDVAQIGEQIRWDTELGAGPGGS